MKSYERFHGPHQMLNIPSPVLLLQGASLNGHRCGKYVNCIMCLVKRMLKGMVILVSIEKSGESWGVVVSKIVAKGTVQQASCMPIAKRVES